jgi:hypothetical protein
MSTSFASTTPRHQRLAHLPVHLLRTRDKTGEPCYFLLRATQANYQKLMTLGGTVNIADYGEILTSGFGTPSLPVRQRVKQEWGIDLPEDC